MGANITGIERRILLGTNEHLFLNKGNENQVSGKAVSPLWMLLDKPSTVNVFMNRGLARYIQDACGLFMCVHFDSGAKTIRTEGTLLRFGTNCFDDRYITNILSLSKVKEIFRIMYDSAEGNQCIMVIYAKDVVFNERQNGIYYHDLEDHYLVIFNTVEDNREAFYRIELPGSSEDRKKLAIFYYPL